MSKELILTELIESLLEYQEKKTPGIFLYDNNNLREAFARYFYFKSTNELKGLLPLIYASKDWNNSKQDENLIKLFHQIKKQSSYKDKAYLFFRKLISLVSLVYLYIACFLFERTPSVKNQKTRHIGFFVLNTRFVNFFSELVEALSGKCSITFLSPDIESIKDDVDKLGCNTQALIASKVNINRIKMPFTHPLFSLYISTVQFYSSIKNSIEKSEISTLVFAEGTSMHDVLAALAAKSLAVKTVRVQSGRAGVLHSGYRNMPYEKMLCWGEGFVERYQTFSLKPQYEIVGSPTVYRLTSEVSHQNKVSRTVGIFTQPLNKYISEQDYLILVDLCYMLINKFPNIKIVIRKHPVDNTTLFDDMIKKFHGQVRFMSSKEFSLANVMQEIDCAVGFYSTVLSEAAACRVLPIILKLEEAHSVFPYPEKYGAAEIATSAEQVVTIVEKLFGKTEYLDEVRIKMDSFADKFFARDLKESPHDKIVDSIMGLCK